MPVCLFVLRGKHRPVGAHSSADQDRRSTDHVVRGLKDKNPRSPDHVVRGSLPPEYPRDYDDLPIIGIMGVHVDDLLCGGAGPEWEAALAKLTQKLKFGDRKLPPVEYCGVTITQSANSPTIYASQGNYVDRIEEPTTKCEDIPSELRRVVGCLIWPAHQTRPDLCFDVSSLGSKVTTATAEDLRIAGKLVRRAKHYKDLGLRFVQLSARWSDLCLVSFSDAGWATRPSNHSQLGVILMLCDPRVAEGETAKGNILDYSSGKITLSTQSSYDAELHACSEAAEVGENTQATIAELVQFGPVRWSISEWLRDGTRISLLVVIDAKGLWTKIQNEWKTEKRGTIYVRRMMEILTRTRAKVFWVNSGHMLADGLTKLSTKSPPPALDLLLHVMTTNDVRITYCEGSWKKELSSRAAGTLQELKVTHPLTWNPPEEEDFDIQGQTLARKAEAHGPLIEEVGDEEGS